MSFIFGILLTLFLVYACGVYLYFKKFCKNSVGYRSRKVTLFGKQIIFGFCKTTFVEALGWPKIIPDLFKED